MLYERKTGWPMFMMIGASYGAFEIEKHKDERTNWHGELLYVGKEGTAIFKKTKAPLH